MYKTLHGMKHHTQSRSTFSFYHIKQYQPFNQTRTSTTHNQTTFSLSLCIYSPISRNSQCYGQWGAGIAQWLEHWTRDWKVAGSNPCWNGGRIFFSRVDFLCWLLFRYPFHPRVTTVARKKSWSFCQKCRWQVTAKHAYTLRIEPCFGIGHNLSLMCQMTSEDIKHQLNNNYGQQ